MTAVQRPPRAAIIIPHYNDPARLERCLDALEPQVRALPGIEVLVVDNASVPPLPPGVQARRPWLRVFVEAEPGAACARNRGVAESSAPILMFIDADCLPDPDWVETGLAVADRAPLVGGHVHVFDETPPPRSGAEAFETVPA